ncbi:MAG TPA: ATP-binding cassette domain-containing protein [Bacilli bacterium]|nr:ATP-binding cassette domain-containing protein [Bacilli bacterium]
MKIKLNDISKMFGDGEGIVKAIDHVSYLFDDTGLYFITGKSGSGKSTLLNIIGGEEEPTNGTVVFDRSDFDPTKEIAYVFQDENLIFSLSLIDNLRIVSGSDAEIKKVLKEVRLNKPFGTHVNLLSKGERARLSIARAVLQKTPIILLDEPTGNLDAENSRQVYEILRGLAKEKIIIVVSHDEATAMKFGDRVIILQDGHLVEEKVLHQKGGRDVGISPWGEKTDGQLSKRIMFKYIFSRFGQKKYKLVFSFLSLFISSILLFVSFNVVFYDQEGLLKRAIDASDVNLYQVFQYNQDDNSIPLGNGREFFIRLTSQIDEEPLKSSLIEADGNNLQLFFGSEINIFDQSIVLSDGEIGISDYVADTSNYALNQNVTILGKSFVISHIVQTDYKVNEAKYSHSEFIDLAATDYSFACINDSQYVELTKLTGITALDYVSSINSSHIVNYSLSGMEDYVDGRAPLESSEITVSQRYVDNYFSGNNAAVLNQDFTLSSSRTMNYDLSAYFAKFKIVGVYDDDQQDSTIFVSNSFYNRIEIPILYDGATQFYIRNQDLPSVVSEIASGAYILSAPSIDPIQNGMYVLGVLHNISDIFISIGFALLTLSFAIILNYSYGNIKTSEKDICLLKTLGVKKWVIRGIFVTMNLLISLVVFVLATLLGSFVTVHLANYFARTYFLTFSVLTNSLYSFLLTFILLLVIPFLISILSVRKIDKCTIANVFKRNLA